MTPEQQEAAAKQAELDLRRVTDLAVYGYEACDTTDGSLICRKPADHDGPHAFS